MSAGATALQPGTLEAAEAASSPSRRPWWHLLRQNRIGLVGAIIVVLVVVTAILAPVISPFDPADQGATRLLGPSGTHLLGTDELGRDTLSRIIFGSRISLQVGVISIAVALCFGGLIGISAGFYGGIIDNVLMRLVDILFAFPGLVLAIVITGLLGPSSRNAMIAIGIIYAPAFARVIRGSVLSVQNESYVEAARVIGVTNGRLVGRHIVPNIMAPMIVLITVYLSSAVLAEASLSFLGLGAQPPTPSWGGMLNAARMYMEINPWMAIAPGIAIMIVVLGLNFLGDGLRDILDPRLRER